MRWPAYQWTQRLPVSKGLRASDTSFNQQRDGGEGVAAACAYCNLRRTVESVPTDSTRANVATFERGVEMSASPWRLYSGTSSREAMRLYEFFVLQPPRNTNNEIWRQVGAHISTLRSSHCRRNRWRLNLRDSQHRDRDRPPTDTRRQSGRISTDVGRLATRVTVLCSMGTTTPVSVLQPTTRPETSRDSEGRVRRYTSTYAAKRTWRDAIGPDPRVVPGAASTYDATRTGRRRDRP